MYTETWSTSSLRTPIPTCGWPPPRPQDYTGATFRDNCYLFFGKETAGLPEEFRLAHYDRCIRIPMRADARSLNLSNSVAILAYEALRQQGFPQLSGVGEMAGGRDGSLPSGAR